MEPFSLLWPKGEKTGSFCFENCREDLELDRMSSLLFNGMPAAEGLQMAADVITDDADTLAWRHDVIGDMLEHPELAETFQEVAELAARIKIYCDAIRANARGLMSGTAPLEGFKKTVTNLEKLLRKGGNMLLEELDPDDYHAQFVRATIFFYEHLKCYTRAMSRLKRVLEQADLRSEALRNLSAWVTAQYAEDKIDETLSQLKKTDSWWKGIAAFAVDVCIGDEMGIESLEMSEIRPKPYSKPGMLDRNAENGFDGLTSIMAFPQSGTSAQYQEYLISELGMQAKPQLSRLRKEIIHLPVAGRSVLIALGGEMRFYSAAVRLARRLREKGMPVVRPTFNRETLMDVDGMYMVELALTRAAPVVSNDVRLGDRGCIDLLTGANSSGKTTYVITAGQLQVLFQMGCWLPAARAALRPVDAIYTLFAAGESDTEEDSRMGLEVARIAEFTKAMTPKSLVLLNESMTSTSASEGIEINIDLLTNLIEKNVSAMIA